MVVFDLNALSGKRPQALLCNSVQARSPSNTCAGAAVMCPEPQHVRLLSVAAVPDLHVGVVAIVSSVHVHLVAVRARCMRAPAQKPLSC
jgi:hypothetical protein